MVASGAAAGKASKNDIARETGERSLSASASLNQRSPKAPSPHPHSALSAYSQTVTFTRFTPHFSACECDG
jgi:hypothetical protein